MIFVKTKNSKEFLVLTKIGLKVEDFQFNTDKIWKEHFNGLFNNKKNKKIIKKKDYVFNEMISTDGYAVSVILRHITEKKGFGKNKKKKMKSFNDFPYISELNDDKLEELKKSTLVGIDPGVNNILTCVDFC